MYISHFQFFLSDGILYYLLAISSLFCLYAKQNAKQQGKSKLLLGKNSWNVLEKIKSFDSSWRILNFKNRKTWQDFFLSKPGRASVMTIWGYFTSAILRLLSSSDASVLGKITLWGTILLSVAVEVLVVSVSGYTASYTVSCTLCEKRPTVCWICLSKLTNHSVIDGSIWDEPQHFSPSQSFQYTLAAGYVLWWW